MDIKLIKTEADYQAALKEISPYFDNEPDLDTPEGDRFELLATLIEAYEDKHYQIPPPDPIEAIKFRMEQMDLKVQDIACDIGGTNRVYEVLNKTRPLSLRMIRNLSEHLGISADVLVKEYETTA